MFSKTQAALAALIALQLAACGGGDSSSQPEAGTPSIPAVPLEPATPVDPANPENPEKPSEPDSKPLVTYLDQTFVGLSELPEGWTKPAANRGTVEVRDGSLFIDGRAHATQMTAVSLPAALQKHSNYRIDVVFTIEAATDSKRWASVMYRTSETPTMEPYYQMAMRQEATLANGTEFAFRNAGGWNVSSTKPFTEKIDPAKTYRATVIVHGNRVRQYLNGELLHDAEMDERYAAGGVGLQTAGALMRVESIKVTEQRDALPVVKLFAPQDTGTKAAVAPTLVQVMSSQTALEKSGASNALFGLDSSLTLKGAGGESIGSLLDYVSQAKVLAIPVLRIENEATVTALSRFVEKYGYTDITLLSSNVELLAQARKAMPLVRAAVDFSASNLTASTADVLKVVAQTNRAKAKIAVLPAAMSTQSAVAHMQRLLITPWAAVDPTAATPEQVAEVLLTGVNGVVTSHSQAYAKVLQKLPANTLLRKPLIIGHRGTPSLKDENTLESAQEAAAAGADVIENDIYMTRDRQLVIMHDGTVDRTTDGTGPIEEMTLAQVKQLKTKSGYAVPTMEEYFDAFKNTKQVHFVEIKSSNPEIVSLLKELVDKKKVHDQLVVISFDFNQLANMAKTMPEVSTGALNSLAVKGGNVESGLRSILGVTQANSSTYNPSYGGGISSELVEAAKHRGLTFWPWTLRNQSDFYSLYSYGTHGLTTDDAHWAQNFPVQAVAAQGATAVNMQTPVALPLTLTTQLGATLNVTSNQMVVLDGTAQYNVQPDGSILFTAPGTATVLPGYRHAMNQDHHYTVFAKPVKLTVQ